MRDILKQRLSDIEGVTVANWKDTDFVCVNFNGKEVAHFHGENVLDLRLSQKIIREENLTRDVSQAIHPCLSPVKLCHYFSVTGGMADGSEAIF